MLIPAKEKHAEQLPAGSQTIPPAASATSSILIQGGALYLVFPVIVLSAMFIL